MSDNAGTTKVVFTKFASSETDETANKYGIKNNRGDIVTNAYLRRYIQCWCRSGDGFTKDREANFAFFMSDEFLSTQRGKTASQVGKAASLSERWGRTVADKPAGRAAARKAQNTAQPTVTAEMMTELMKRFEMVGGVWVERKIVPDDAELAAEIQVVAEGLTDVSRDELAAVVEQVKNEIAEIVPGPDGEPVAIAKPPKRKSKAAQAEAELADIVADKPAMIEALQETL